MRISQSLSIKSVGCPLAVSYGAMGVAFESSILTVRRKIYIRNGQINWWVHILKGAWVHRLGVLFSSPIYTHWTQKCYNQMKAEVLRQLNNRQASISKRKINLSISISIYGVQTRRLYGRSLRRLSSIHFISISSWKAPRWPFVLVFPPFLSWLSALNR